MFTKLTRYQCDSCGYTDFIELCEEELEELITCDNCNQPVLNIFKQRRFDIDEATKSFWA